MHLKRGTQAITLLFFHFFTMETGGGDCVSRGAGQDLVAVVFEVHGRVQGVFFRVHTQEHAQHLGLTGWVQNMPGGTVKGEAEGPSAQVEKMLHWLRHVGSPQSRIDQLDILEKKSIAQRNYSSFEIIRKKRA